MSDPKGVPNVNRVSRLARAVRHSSENEVETLEIGPTSPPSFCRRFWLPGSPQE
jgi:hypothetical protein